MTRREASHQLRVLARSMRYALPDEIIEAWAEELDAIADKLDRSGAASSIEGADGAPHGVKEPLGSAAPVLPTP